MTQGATNNREEWGICADCGVYERASKLNEDGLCFWCTPEGKERMKEIDARYQPWLEVHEV